MYVVFPVHCLEESLAFFQALDRKTTYITQPFTCISGQNNPLFFFFFVVVTVQVIKLNRGKAIFLLRFFFLLRFSSVFFIKQIVNF